jgi:hypothetical protein
MDRMATAVSSHLLVNKSVDAKPNLHFRRNVTIKTTLQAEGCQVSKPTTVATKSKKHVSRRGCWNSPATPITRKIIPDQKATAASAHLLVTTISADAKLDLHFRRDGATETPAECEGSQFGKSTTAATKSKKHVRRRNRRMRGRWIVLAMDNTRPKRPVVEQIEPNNRAMTASSHLLAATNRRIRNQTYISVGMVPEILPNRVRYVKLVSLPLPTHEAFVRKSDDDRKVRPTRYSQF